MAQFGADASGKESKVVVAPDSSGKSIRNIQVTTLVPDPTTGTPTPTVIQMQVLAVADEYGRLLDLDLNPTLDELILVQRRAYALLRIIAEVLTDDTSGRHSISSEDELLDPAWNSESTFGSN